MTFKILDSKKLPPINGRCALIKSVRIGDIELNLQIYKRIGDRVELCPFERETAGTVYLNRFLDLTGIIEPLS